MGRKAAIAAPDWLATAYDHAIDDVLTKAEASRLSERIYMYKNMTWNHMEMYASRGILDDADDIHARLTAINQDLRNAEWWMRSQEKIARPQAEAVLVALNELVSVSDLLIESLPQPEYSQRAEAQERWFEWIKACRVYFINRAQDEIDSDEEPESKRRSRKSTSLRAPLTPQQRRAVYDKTDGICWYCGKQTDAILNFHVDHVHPVALGGSNDSENLVPCCRECNTTKRTRTIDAFRAARGGGPFWFERREAQS